ncbi:MAG TPA: GlyGly-CTERM sorting domain-containing protein [Gammaproteobacteria bacterium]|nr:GlyGly-CTERM sorting domain-containing protein [Gammaproteobacteria bacterium]
MDPVTNRSLGVDGYHRDDFPNDDYLYSRRDDDNNATDVFVHHINLAPVFDAKDQYHCKNAGAQFFYLWNWLNHYDDGDHPGERENLRFEVHYVENPGLFGGLLDVGGQPNVTWPSQTLSYRIALGESGSSEVCLQLHDDGLTAQGGHDLARRCFTVHVDPNCDDGNGEIFGTNLFEFDHLAANKLALNILDFDKSSSNGNSHDVKVKVSNNGTESVKNAELHLALRGADKVVEADPRCESEGDGATGEYLCKFSEIPVGGTTLNFKALGVGEITGAGGFEPANEEVPEVAGTSAVNGDSGSQDSVSGGSNGGGSLGWLSLIALGLLGRRKLRK